MAFLPKRRIHWSRYIFCYFWIFNNRNYFEVNQQSQILIYTILFQKNKISFILNIICVYKSTKFDFYFPFCRFWQMAVGGLLTFFNKSLRHKSVCNFLSIGSFLFILYISLTIDENSLFPGFWALAPTLSASAIILSGQSFLNKYILSNKVALFIGKISYPLYLWHWPLIVFCRIFYPKGSDSIFSSEWIILSVSLLFSIVTYYLIQNNLRFSKRNFVLYFLIISMLVIGIASFTSYKNPQKMYEIFGKNSQSNIFDTQQQIINEDESSQVNPLDSQQQISNQMFKKIGIDLDQKFQLLMIPGPNDYIQKNGRKIPNSSKNPDRVSPNKEQIQYIINKVSNYHWKSQKGPLQINPISSQSKYYEKVPWQLGPTAGRFNVINQGRQNQLFIIGDSFGENIGWRFRMLYQKSLQNNKLSEFPTIVYLIQRGKPYFHCANLFNFSIQYIKKHKPQRLFLSYHWLHQLAFDPKIQSNQPHDMTTECHWDQATYGKRRKSDALQDLRIASQVMKQFVDLGIQVYTTGFHPFGGNLNPNQMADLNGIIQKNIKPVKLSAFRQQNQQIIKLFQDAIKIAGVKIIDYSENQCWNDLCQVAVPSGFPIFFDHSHFIVPYSIHWLSAVDFLTKF